MNSWKQAKRNTRNFKYKITGMIIKKKKKKKSSDTTHLNMYKSTVTLQYEQTHKYTKVFAMRKRRSNWLHGWHHSPQPEPHGPVPLGALPRPQCLSVWPGMKTASPHSPLDAGPLRTLMMTVPGLPINRSVYALYYEVYRHTDVNKGTPRHGL